MSNITVTRAKGDTEITPVSTETEVMIPWQNYTKLGTVLTIVILGAWSIIWLLWARNLPSRSTMNRWRELAKER